MNEISDRIRDIVSSTGLTKTAFAKKLNVTQQYISNLCLGKKAPSDRTIADICREFHVSETWLRTGEGEMFVELPRNEALAAQIQAFLQGEANSFRERFVSLLLRLAPEQWDMLESYLVELMDERIPAPVALPKTETPTPAPDTSGRERADRNQPMSIDEKVELYRQQLLSEEEQAKQASSANGSAVG